MNTHKHILKRLAVLADPEHKGKHPLHDSRWIATEGSSFEEERYPGQWELDNGSLVAQMRDCEDQGQYARVMAAGPQMLHYLRSARAWIRQAGGDVATFDSFLSQFDDVA